MNNKYRYKTYRLRLLFSTCKCFFRKTSILTLLKIPFVNIYYMDSCPVDNLSSVEFDKCHDKAIGPCRRTKAQSPLTTNPQHF